MKPPVLILHATGTNRDRDAALACELAGGAPEIVHINAVLGGERDLMGYRFVLLPGGFSYGDDLGAGQLWAVALRHGLGESLARFVEAGRPVLGICNGFQVLVKSGLLPGPMGGESGVFGRRRVTLARNERGEFVCRWVMLEVEGSSRSIFTSGLTERIHCPVAHGEGRFAVDEASTLRALEEGGQIALRYVDPEGGEAVWPHNPNGSVGSVAGICNGTGTVMGMMPHPEDHIVGTQHPRFHRGESGNLGLALFERAIRYASQLD